MQGSAHMTQDAFSTLWLLAVGALCTTSQALPVYRSLRTRRWASIPARVLQSQAAPRRWPVTGAGKNGPFVLFAHVLVVRYTYTVDQKAYTSTRFSFFGYPPWSTSIATLADRYHKGASVRAWYDPSNPQEAVLERGPAVVNLVVLAVGVCLLVAGVPWLVAVVAT
jgi:hypothetical protein